jgi:hypothetical protein
MSGMTTVRHAIGVSMVVAMVVAILAQAAFAGPHRPAQPNAGVHMDKMASSADPGPAPTSVELDELAHAIVATGNIKRAARPGIANAPDAADRARLEQAAANRIKAAIRSNHLSVHRYLQIVAFVQTHPAEQRKVVARLKLLMPSLPLQQPLD